MTILFYTVNAMVNGSIMFFAWNFYKFKGKDISFGRFWISIGLLTVTVVITSLQFIFPEIIPALNRNRESILSGEVWRLITPLFIQPMGIAQCVFNALFFVSFVPIAEYLYGKRVLLIYFGTGLVGQLVNFYWETTPGGLATSGGGSSTALYGTMGALVMYVLMNIKRFPKGYMLIPVAVFLGAVILIFFEDGHAPSLLVGGVLGFLLSKKSRSITAYPQVRLDPKTHTT